MKKLSTKTEVIEKVITQEVPVGIILELSLEELAYIQSRLDCSSFKTYADFCPDRIICRRIFAENFAKATNINS